MNMANKATPAVVNPWSVELGLEDDYWTAYESMRPHYADSSFLELVYDYHTSKPNSPSFNVAHDVGCGFGKATIEIVKQFISVVASDSNGSSLTAAQKRLAPLARNITFLQCTGEQLVEYYPPQSADFISAAECIPLMDSPVALAGFAQLLKPNGTLAIWFYGRAHFTEQDYKAKCQPLFDRIMNLTFAKVIKADGLEGSARWKKAADAMASWLDNLDFSSGDWGLVQRRKWNSKSAKMGFSQEACDFKIEPIRNVRNNEETTEKEDAELWKGSWNIHGVMNYIYSSFPGVKEKVTADIEIDELFRQLAEAMGGESAVRHYTWPVVLILATRLGPTVS